MIYKGHELKPGDVVTYRTNLTTKDPISFVSLGVRVFTNCWFNHSAVVVQRGETLFLNEAIAQGVVSRPLSEVLVRPYNKLMIMRPYQVRDDFNERANSKIGVPYDYWSLLFFQVIYRTTGVWIGPIAGMADRIEQCAEYVSWCHELPEWWRASTKEVVTSPKLYVLATDEYGG